MNATPPVISVIIPTYNEEAGIAKCLASVLRQDLPLPYEILVVDGPSTDRTRSIVRQFPVRLIRLEQRGIGLAWKTGAAQSRADLLVFTEADTVVPADWLSTIHRTLSENPQAIGISGCFILQNTPRLLNRLGVCVEVAADHLHKWLKGTVPFRGKNFAIRKPALCACGDFDEEVELYGDVELSLRARQHGQILHLPALLVTSINRNLSDWASTLRFLRRFANAMFWIEIAGQPHRLKFPQAQTNSLPRPKPDNVTSAFRKL